MLHLPIDPRSLGASPRSFGGEADEALRAVITDEAGLIELSRFSWALEARASGRGFRLTGRITADLVQACVVTLEPVPQHIDEPVDQLFMPEPGTSPKRRDGDDALDEVEIDPDGPEHFSGHSADIGPFLVESLLVAIDPYPRAPGATLDEALAREQDETPFAAALKRLKAPEG